VIPISAVAAGLVDFAIKLKVLRDTYSDTVELERILSKLLDVILSQHRLRLERYEHDLRDFERRYGMETLLREEAQEDVGLFRYRLTLNDGGLLEMFERFQIVDERLRVTKYRFHC
jgi:hypothetical protein